jgi:hypothetical protein
VARLRLDLEKRAEVTVELRGSTLPARGGD